MHVLLPAFTYVVKKPTRFPLKRRRICAIPVEVYTIAINYCDTLLISLIIIILLSLSTRHTVLAVTRQSLSRVISSVRSVRLVRAAFRRFKSFKWISRFLVLIFPVALRKIYGCFVYIRPCRRLRETDSYRHSVSHGASLPVTTRTSNGRV